MTYEAFIEKDFKPVSWARIHQAIDIIAEYRAEGFTLTLRQLYYQFVARDLLPNTQQSYKNLGSLINDARLAGLIDWRAIEDRTRFLRSNNHWSSGAAIVKACASQFALDKWTDQEWYVEVWIEKDALIGVIERVCSELDVPYFACRGYSSQSEQWRAGLRLREVIADGRRPLILHLGDHDPSGMDMTRDNQERLSMFALDQVEVKRIALNWDQIEEYNPPPNPAKLTDSRAGAYVKRYGRDSWELDALDPRVIEELIESEVLAVRDDELWDQAVEDEDNIKAHLADTAETLQNKGV